MSGNEFPSTSGRRNRRLGWGAGLLAAGALGGAVLAGTLPASASTTTAGSTSPEASQSGQPPAAANGERGPAGAGRPGSGTPGQRPDEKVLTGALAAQAKAAALKAVPGATVDRVETDADGAVYEAHVTKADGMKVTVKFDKSFAVQAVQVGMGTTKKPTTSATR